MSAEAAARSLGESLMSEGLGVVALESLGSAATDVHNVNTNKAPLTKFHLSQADDGVGEVSLRAGGSGRVFTLRIPYVTRSGGARSTT